MILFDWVEKSVVAGAANAPEVTRSLVAELHSRLLVEPGLNIHLIGFSRGSYLNAEILRDLSSLGVDDKLGSVQMTTLDPQSFWLTPFDTDGELVSNPGGIVDWADNYYQEAGSFLIPGDQGKTIKGALNIEITASVKQWAGRNGIDDESSANHSEVHDWYHFTIDTVDDFPWPYGDVPVVGSRDRSTLFPVSTWQLGERAGYYWSNMGGGSADRPVAITPVVGTFPQPAKSRDYRVFVEGSNEFIVIGIPQVAGGGSVYQYEATTGQFVRGYATEHLRWGAEDFGAAMAADNRHVVIGAPATPDSA